MTETWEEVVEEDLRDEIQKMLVITKDTWWKAKKNAAAGVVEGVASIEQKGGGQGVGPRRRGARRQ